MATAAEISTDIATQNPILEERKNHRHEALLQFSLYRSMQRLAIENSKEPLHVLFNFLDIFLLPSYMRNTREINFTTGL